MDDNEAHLLDSEDEDDDDDLPIVIFSNDGSLKKVIDKLGNEIKNTAGSKSNATVPAEKNESENVEKDDSLVNENGSGEPAVRNEIKNDDQVDFSQQRKKPEIVNVGDSELVENEDYLIARVCEIGFDIQDCKEAIKDGKKSVNDIVDWILLGKQYDEDIISHVQQMGFKLEDCLEAIENRKFSVQDITEWILLGKPKQVPSEPVPSTSGETLPLPSISRGTLPLLSTSGGMSPVSSSGGTPPVPSLSGGKTGILPLPPSSSGTSTSPSTSKGTSPSPRGAVPVPANSRGMLPLPDFSFLNEPMEKLISKDKERKPSTPASAPTVSSSNRNVPDKASTKKRSSLPISGFSFSDEPQRNRIGNDGKSTAASASATNGSFPVQDIPISNDPRSNKGKQKQSAVDSASNGNLPFPDFFYDLVNKVNETAKPKQLKTVTAGSTSNEHGSSFVSTSTSSIFGGLANETASKPNLTTTNQAASSKDAGNDKTAVPTSTSTASTSRGLPLPDFSFVNESRGTAARTRYHFPTTATSNSSVDDRWSQISTFCNAPGGTSIFAGNNQNDQGKKRVNTPLFDYEKYFAEKRRRVIPQQLPQQFNPNPITSSWPTSTFPRKQSFVFAPSSSSSATATSSSAMPSTASGSRPLRSDPKLLAESDDDSDNEIIINERFTPQISDNNEIEKRIRVPDYWDLNLLSAKNSEYHLVQLSDLGETYEEYFKIATMFHKTMDLVNNKILSIQRIQNLELWESFALKKIKMQRKSEKGIVKKKYLFHGTRQEIVQPICRQGFDFRVAGSSNACMYGKGSYFATYASYSSKYTFSRKVAPTPTSALSRNKCSIIVAQVLVGEYALGRHDYVRPPPKDHRDPMGDLYDSCVDNNEHPHIFVIFAMDQAYPEYLIEYESFHNPPDNIAARLQYNNHFQK